MSYNIGGVAEWLKAADCKSARIAYVGSNPTPTTNIAEFYTITIERFKRCLKKNLIEANHMST